MSAENFLPDLAPMDEFNTKLLNQVRPPNWKNPTPKGTYHLVAIGAGAAGLISAAGAAGLGARVAIIERNLMGGDCLNVGCVPSKGVIRAARAWHAAARAKDFGGPSLMGEGDFGQAMQRMRKLRAEISPVDGAQRFRDLGIDVFIGHASFTGPDTLEVGGQTLRFKKAVITTGARASALPIPGLSEAGYLTNENFFNQTSLPKRLGIIGAGPIGCEMAQSFARFGSEVSVLDIGEHVLPREDADAARIVQAALKRDGVLYIPSAQTQKVERRGAERVVHYQVKGQARELIVDELFVAVGRTPNLENLGLEAAGVRAHARGVEVDDYLRTSNKRIFA
ncbi:MAG: FAD-dependent oxidoreductase, partial [Deltaproteobacteria bacterium]|nr:FAD-dependent oxidoreductase [Deltaproteobacteria bacterium]